MKIDQEYARKVLAESQAVPVKDISPEYAQKMFVFTEEVREMLGFGYGEGHDFSDMLRVLKARDRELDKCVHAGFQWRARDRGGEWTPWVPGLAPSVIDRGCEVEERRLYAVKEPRDG